MFAKCGQEFDYLTGDYDIMNKAKMMCCCMVDLVQVQDNNANEIHEKTYILWDFHHSL